jgi:hypothetical protein
MFGYWPLAKVERFGQEGYQIAYQRFAGEDLWVLRKI